MKNYAEEERLMSQPQKMLISSFTLQNRTLFTPPFLFSLQLGLVVLQKYTVSLHTLQKTLQQFCTVSSGRQKVR